MGKRAGGGAAGSAAAASTSAVAGLEPAAGRGGGPRSAAAGLLGALHLVMTLVVAAARAEKEGGCQPAGISRARPRAVTAPSRRPLPGCHRGGRAAARGSEGGRAQGSVRREVARSSLVPSRELAVRMPTRGFDRTELLLFSVILSPRLTPVFPLVSCHCHFKTS